MDAKSHSHEWSFEVAPDRPLSGKRVVLGITGSIAAYKAGYIASGLVRLGATVDVAITESAQRFIGAQTFSALTHRPVTTSLWDANSAISIDHVALGIDADCVVIAPATANTLAKLALGIVDDVVTATVSASAVPLVLAPAMDADMYRSKATQRNVSKLKEDGVFLVGPERGRLASGLVGAGRMSEPEDVIDAVRAAIGIRSGDYSGKRVVVTAGGTREAIDPVRVITNRSTGKMGYAIAAAARDRGAYTILISAPTVLRAPGSVKFAHVETVNDMREATLPACEDADLLIMAAAISDFRPAIVPTQKIKKSDQRGLTIELETIEDWMPRVIGDHLTKVAFAAETGDAVASAAAKGSAKGAAFTVANDVSEHGSGFGTDTNRVDIVAPDGRVENLPLMSKYAVANAILDRALPIIGN